MAADLFGLCLFAMTPCTPFRPRERQTRMTGRVTRVIGNGSNYIATRGQNVNPFLIFRFFLKSAFFANMMCIRVVSK